MMIEKTVRLPRWLVLALLCLFVQLCALPGESFADTKPAEQVEDKLRHAWTYYWLGITELGDLRSFERGLGFIAQAKKLDKEDGGVDHAQAIERAQSALEEQRGLAEITLRGNFPLTAFLGASIFIDATSLGTYEIIDEPYDAAVSQMAELLRDEIMSQWSIPIQTDVLVISSPPNRTFENKVNFLIERSPKINVLPLGMLKDKLSKADLSALEEGTPDALSDNLASLLGTERLLLINVVEVDIIDEVYFYEFQATMWQPSLGRKPLKSMVKRGIVRDRRERRWPFILTMLAMFLVGTGGVLWLSRDRADRWEAITISVMGFLAGTVSPHIVLQFLDTLQPHEEELVKLAFWWPLVAGLVILIAPSVVFITLTKRLGPSVPVLKRANDLGAEVALAIGAGACAYMSRGALVYDDQWGWLLAWIALPGAIGAARLVAALRTHQLRSPVHGAMSTIGTIALPLAVFSWSIPLTLVASAMTLGGVWALGPKPEGARHEGHGAHDDEEDALAEEELGLLISRARRPPYRAFEPYLKAREHVLVALERDKIARVNWLMLQGQKGSGKTATSSALVESLREGAVLLHGVCPPPSNEDIEGDGDGHEGKPFEVFAQAFGDASVFGLEDIESDVFSELEDTVFDAIPIVSLLLPAGDDAGRAVSDRGELYIRIERELIRKTKKGTRPVILWLDDIQWLDNASQSMLGHLLERFPASSPHPILFLLCGRELPVRSPLAERHQRYLREVMIRVELDEPQRLRLLQEAIGFDERSARLLDGAVTDSEGKSNLAWLLTLVEAVAQEGKVRYEDDEFQLTVEDSESLPIPDNFKKMVGGAYEKLARDERELMRAATCMGSAFSIEVLSRVTGRDRLTVLDILEHVSSKTHLVEDNMAVDDLFQFVSAQRYVALRDHLRLQDMHPKVQAPQILRDLHFQVAQIMESLWLDQLVSVSDVAHHYYNAGRRDLKKALRFCRMAARSAMDVFAYDNAEFQLKRALVCAEMLSKTLANEAARQEALAELAALELELKLLPFEKAHVLGLSELTRQNAQSARQVFDQWQELGGLEAPEHTPPLSLLIRMARACYDAREFGLAIEIARALEALGALSAELPQDDIALKVARIEGLHFIGLSLSPRDEAAERLAYLERARDETEALELELEQLISAERLDDPQRAQAELEALKGRVYNSLGEQLSQRVTYDFMLARQWFHRSIDIKKSLKPEDKPGLARAYGGLGRLHLFFSESQEGSGALDSVERARSYFEEDLALCQDYGDVAGECQMRSHLGDCALRQGHPLEAISHYEDSVRLAATPMNKAFALLGLLKAQDRAASREGATAVAAQIISHFQEDGFASFLHQQLYGVLQSCHIDTGLIDGFDKIFDELEQRFNPPSPTLPEPIPQAEAQEQGGDEEE